MGSDSASPTVREAADLPAKPPADTPTASDVLAWSAHPAREQPGRAVMGAVWAVAFIAMVYATTASPFWAALSLVLLTVALSRFYFPSRFRMDEDGVTAQYLLSRQHLPWRAIRRWAADEDGAYLSRFERPSRFDAWRGLHIRFGGADREAVLAMIHQYVDAAAGRTTECRMPDVQCPASPSSQPSEITSGRHGQRTVSEDHA